MQWNWYRLMQEPVNYMKLTWKRLRLFSRYKPHCTVALFVFPFCSSWICPSWQLAFTTSKSDPNLSFMRTHAFSETPHMHTSVAVLHDCVMPRKLPKTSYTSNNPCIVGVPAPCHSLLWWSSNTSSAVHQAEKVKKDQMANFFFCLFFCFCSVIFLFSIRAVECIYTRTSGILTKNALDRITT